MKKGSGSNPFAETEDEEPEAEPTTDTKSNSEPANTDESNSSSDSAKSVSAEESTQSENAKTGASVDGSEPDSSGAVIGEPPQDGADDDGVPWVYVRDNVKQDRDMVQFYLRDYVVEAEDDFVDAVSDELGTSVSKTDVREAAYEAAMHNVDEVVERLRAWGFESVD